MQADPPIKNLTVAKNTKKEKEMKHLEVNEDLYRSLLENVHDGIYRSTCDGKILTANPALVRMLGYNTEEELKEKNIGSDIYVSGKERESFLKQINKRGRLKDVELVLRKKDGTHITVLENSHTVRNKEGKVLLYEGTLTEISERKKAEEALRESENRYHTLIETLQDGISLFDFTGKLLYFNNPKKTMLGYEQDNDLLHVNTFDLIHPDDRPKAQKIFRELISKGAFSQKELRVVRKDGSWFWAEFSASILKDASGNPHLIMDSMRDISERKKAEDELRVLKHSIDVQYDGVYWLDPDNRIIYVNDAACRETGYKREELLGSHVILINPQATDELMKLVWEKLRKKGSFTGEASYKRKNGSEFPVEIVSTYVKFGGREYNCGFARDITERKKAAGEMKLRLEQMRQIIDLVPSYIFAKDIDGKFLLANKALADVFGLSPEEIQGKSDSDYGATKEQIVWYRKYDMEVIKKGVPVIIPEEQVLRKDGSLGWFQTVKIPYRHPGYHKPAILGVATEITDRKIIETDLIKAKEKAEESDRLKTAFLHNISHEIRTPMNAIVGFTSLLETPRLPEEIKKQYIQIILGSSNQLLAIISDIVDISNIETGHVNISNSDINLKGILKKLCEQFSPRAEEAGLKLNCHPDPSNGLKQIVTDEIKLIQILSNLLNNSLKFTAKGSIDLGYEVKENVIEFYVRDTGKGINKADLPRIFDRFYQADVPTNQKTEGTGLGLAICKGYAELMGGSIRAESRPGKGSEFRLTLPLIKVKPGKGRKTK
jgi:PAS domain S-box-containing protein